MGGLGDGQRSDDAAFDDLVPGWLFVLHSTWTRVAAALLIPLLFASPLAFISEPDTIRLGPLLVPAIIAVAALAGWWPTLMGGSIVTLLYWWYGVPLSNSFRFGSPRDAIAVFAMAVLVVAVSVLTRTIERSVANVRALDATNRERVITEAATRHEAEQARAYVQAALAMANRLAPQQTMADVARVALESIDVPYVPTGASVSIVRDNHLSVLAAHATPPELIAALEAVDLRTTDWMAEALAGTLTIVEDRERFAREHPHAGVLRIYLTGSWAVVPFRSENTIGLLSLYYLAPLPLLEYETYFTLVAEILAGALERAHAEERRRRNLEDLERAFTERDRIARTLSATLLPPRLPAVPGFSVDGWLLPAHDDEVAGDFYDLFPVAEGEWVAVLGDVCGKGAEAAAVTSLARHAARIGAMDNPDSASIANVANAALADDPSDLFCTMAIVRYRGEREEIDVTLAGHHQVRVVADGGVCRVGEFGPVLSMGETKAAVDSHPFGPGDSVVLFSDGLVERALDFGENELDALLADAPSGNASAIADHVRTRVLALAPHRHDDLTLLVVTRDPS